MNNQANTLLQKAVASFQQGDVQTALGLCEEVLRGAPGHPEAGHLKAMALARSSRLDEAISAFESAAVNHSQAYAVLNNLGNVLRSAGRPEAAMAAYERALSANGKFTPAWTGLGIAAKLMDDSEKAEHAFRKAVELQPNDAGALNNLAVLLADGERWREAVDLFGRALTLKPDMTSALINRGAALRNLGSVDAALRDHRRGAALASNMGEAHYQLANSLLRARDPAAAEASFRQALSLEPMRTDIHRDFARMLWEQGQSDTFLTPLDDALAQTPAPGLFRLKGELAFRSGQLAIAAESASRALSANAEDAEALILLAGVHRKEGKLDEAINLAANAHAISPKDFGVCHEFVEILMVAGKFDRAVQLLDFVPPAEHLQKHVALKAIALRASGADTYKSLYDYDRFTAAKFIKTPEGYDSMAAFNDALLSAIQPLHATRQQPLDQTLYGGTQSVGKLWDEPHPVIQTLKTALLLESREFIRNLPDDPAHPFLSRKTEDIACAGAWSVMLSSGGGHVDHIHPDGWISAVYYLRVPEEVSMSEKAGFLRLGASGIDGLAMEAERWIKPEEGLVVFFPSYIWHGVEKFEASSQRVTAPFDLAPALTTG